MASTYTLAVRTTGTASGSAALEIIAGATSIIVVSIEIFTSAATASQFGIGRPNAKGVNPTSPVTFLSQVDGTTTSQATIALAWGTGPTLPPKFAHKGVVPAAIGGRLFFSVSQPLATGSTIVLWNLALNSACDANIVISE